MPFIHPKHFPFLSYIFRIGFNFLRRMRYVAAYLLATLGGNEQPTTEDVKRILKSVGIEYDDSRAKSLLSQVSGKDVNAV
jgi:hypothetical protein